MPDCTERCFTNISQFSVRKPRGKSINDSFAKQTNKTNGRLRLYICQPNELAKTKLQNWPTFPSRHKGLG